MQLFPVKKLIYDESIWIYKHRIYKQIIYHCFLNRFFHVKKNKLTPILIIQFSWKYGLENADVNVGT